ncbi:hypothetical protein [Arenibacter echinorum]|uniref:DoxX-like protein n=1 Tax=Arenibacter echinorum TaxID=440515 RepID=A0A327R3V3_9FLAO|nr:hypothetical protein [Arenibacter echinorum]RAJ11506.1 hypothetical protein LV92_02434 [Arenibacter echinorum]
MEALEEFLVPYVISQIVSIVILIVALKNTRTARGILSVLFLWASATNMYYGLSKPEIYLEYGDMALPFYRDFIEGWFSHNKHILIPLIAFGQFFIGIGMLLKGWFVKLACFGAIIFFIAISPLMVGSAFPFSITVSIAVYIVLKKDGLNYLWRKKSTTKVN